MFFASLKPLVTRHNAIVALIVVAAFLLSHPYTGVRHDGTLYAGEALARLLPGQLTSDLYFLYGSQGQFTLFPRVYAVLIDAFGVGRGTIVGLLLAAILYLAASAYLIAALVPPRWRWACLLSIVLGWTIYGGNRIFAFSEAFLTARSFAEPVVLLGVACLIRSRLIPAVVTLLAALFIHPLIAAGGIFVAWAYLCLLDRRWLWLGALGSVAFLALGLSGIGPFSDVLARYDPQWRALVQEANPQAFVLKWSALDFGVIAFSVAILWFGTRVTACNANARRLIVAAAVAGVGATVASLVGVDLLGNPFLGKLQIWRAEWVMQWVAMAIVPVVLVDLWQRGPHGRIAALLIGVGWMAPFSLAPAPLALMAIAVVALQSRFAISQTTVRIVQVMTALIAAVIVFQYELRIFRLGGLFNQPASVIAAQALTMNIVLIFAATAVIRWSGHAQKTGLFIAVVLLMGAASLWDQRSAWTQRLESYPTGEHVWSDLIEPTAKVYWYRDLSAPWLLLGHGNYYTQQQGSGAVFSRDMVVELDRRRKVTALLDFQEQICRMMNNLSEKASSCEPDVEAVRTVCTDGGIDYVVLQSSVQGGHPVGEYSTGVIENGYEKKFFLYRCKAL